MKQLKKYIGGTGDVLGIIGKTLGSYFCDGIGNCGYCGLMPVCEVFADVYRSQRDGIRQVSQYERR